MAPPDRQLRQRDGERARFIHLRPMSLWNAGAKGESRSGSRLTCCVASCNRLPRFRVAHGQRAPRTPRERRRPAVAALPRVGVQPLRQHVHLLPIQRICPPIALARVRLALGARNLGRVRPLRRKSDSGRREVAEVGRRRRRRPRTWRAVVTVWCALRRRAGRHRDGTQPNCSLPRARVGLAARAGRRAASGARIHGREGPGRVAERGHETSCAACCELGSAPRLCRCEFPA